MLRSVMHGGQMRMADEQLFVTQFPGGYDEAVRTFLGQMRNFMHIVKPSRDAVFGRVASEWSGELLACALPRLLS